MIQPVRRIKDQFLLRNYISGIREDRLHKLSRTNMLWKHLFRLTCKARTPNKGGQDPWSKNSACFLPHCSYYSFSYSEDALKSISHQAWNLLLVQSCKKLNIEPHSYRTHSLWIPKNLSQAIIQVQQSRGKISNHSFNDLFLSPTEPTSKPFSTQILLHN